MLKTTSCEKVDGDIKSLQRYITLLEPRNTYTRINGGVQRWVVGALFAAVISLTKCCVKASLLPSHILQAKIPGWLDRSKESFQPSQQHSTSKIQEQLWMYQGFLYDPLDGRQIAQVQGLELVRPVLNTTHLAIDDVLSAPNASYHDARTLWSQKIFCYTPTSTILTNSTGTSILRHVRLRPQSPKKRVPLNQALVAYETATSFVSTSPDSAERNGELLVHSEFPNGQTVWGMADHNIPASKTESSRRQSSTTFSYGIDFTVYTKLRSRRSPMYAPDLTSKKETSTTGDDLVIAPKRAAIIQFGSSSGTMESKHKFGARESYSYRNILPVQTQPWWKRFWQWNGRQNRPPATSLYYTRYGEGPPFYAPGRMCMLELSAKPIQSLHDCTPFLQQLLETNGGPIVNFHCVKGVTSPTIQEAWGIGSSKMRKLLPKESSRSPQVLGLREEQAMGNNGKWSTLSRWAHKRSGQAMTLRERIQAATAIEASL
ncbi:hypothetical protein IV203_008679 [Nitzschia inconspicua]|uniref:Uncharacterized protein n=1 Tax=Nitzschia inconspicua TaxID=303405 RepID=A0A9K3PMX5_9STRA|nr:hypothetical protein IV203_008679 [Nitzschia inconspicua]